MPTLDELRAWLQGRDVPGMPTHAEVDAEASSASPWVVPGTSSTEAATPVAPGKDDADTWRTARYVVSKDGKDAILKFGRWRDKRVSELTESMAGVRYLDWMLRQDFAPELLDIVRHNRASKAPVFYGDDDGDGDGDDAARVASETDDDDE